MRFLTMIPAMAAICLAIPAPAPAPAPAAPLDPATLWFGLQDQDRFVHKGCDLRLNNICGCTASVDIDYWHACKSGNRKKSNTGGVCGGTWTVVQGDGGHDLYTFENKVCKASTCGGKVFGGSLR
ncbi:hypothetical protein Q9189_001222 [Teloschistes chrysophthalmus]